MNEVTERKVQTQTATETAGDGEYVVRQGECLNSIANDFGFFWETLWNLPENRQLKDARKDHNMLLPGDRLHVPDLRRKEEPGTTETRHIYRRKGVPSLFRIRLLEDESPEKYADQPYRLVVDGIASEGAVDEEGWLSLPIDPSAKNIVLSVGEGDNAEEFELAVSSVDPIDTPTGVQQRLRNLGYLDAEPEDRWSEEAVEALREFQSAHVDTESYREPSGVLDENTRGKLVEVYGC